MTHATGVVNDTMATSPAVQPTPAAKLEQANSSFGCGTAHGCSANGSNACSATGSANPSFASLEADEYLERRTQEVAEHYNAVDFKALHKCGHRRCWRFLTHPEGWVDNIGVLLVVSVPLWVFSWVIWQGSLPSIFVLGAMNVLSISSCLLLIVPDSRKPSTYLSRAAFANIVNFDKKMTPNSWRHLYLLASFIFQLLVLVAVVVKELEIFTNLVLLPDRVAAPTPQSWLHGGWLYTFADSLSTSPLGNLVTLALTAFTAMFFGFAWVIGCFENR